MPVPDDAGGAGEAGGGGVRVEGRGRAGGGGGAADGGTADERGDLRETERKKMGVGGGERGSRRGAVERDCNVLSKRTSRNLTSSAI